MSDTVRYVDPKWNPSHWMWVRYGFDKKVKSEKHQKRDRPSRTRTRSGKVRHRFINGHGIVKNSRHNLIEKVEAMSLQEHLEEA